MRQENLHLQFFERSLAETRSSCQNNCSATGNGFQFQHETFSTHNQLDYRSESDQFLRVLVNCHEQKAVCARPDTHTHFKPGNGDYHAQHQL